MTRAHTTVTLPDRYYSVPAIYRKQVAKWLGTPWPPRLPAQGENA